MWGVRRCVRAQVVVLATKPDGTDTDVDEAKAAADPSPAGEDELATSAPPTKRVCGRASRLPSLQSRQLHVAVSFSRGVLSSASHCTSFASTLIPSTEHHWRRAGGWTNLQVVRSKH